MHYTLNLRALYTIQAEKAKRQCPYIEDFSGYSALNLTAIKVLTPLGSHHHNCGYGCLVII